MDVTALSDVQLDHLIGQIGADPFNEDYDSVEALRREKRRRLAARSAANVEQDLEASAAPIAMEPVAGDGLRPKPTREQMDAAILAPITVEGKPIPGFDPSMGIGLSMSNPTDRAAYGQVFGDALRRHHQRGDAAATARRQGGYQDPEQVAYNEVTGAPGTYLPPQPPGMRGDTVMVDGVEVPAYRLSDGLPFGGMFREGDYRAARDAAAEADWQSRFRANIAADRARYGDPMAAADDITPEQYAAREARKRAELNEQQSARAKELRAGRLSARAGVPEQITDNMSPDAQLRAMARNKEAARVANARGIITRRAQAQNNPLEYLGREDVNDWQKMVMADRLLRKGAGEMTPLGVEAVGGQNALGMLRGMNLGQGMDNPLVRAQAVAAGGQARAAEAEMSQAIATDADSILDEYADEKGWLNLPTRLVGGGVAGWDNTLLTMEEEENAIRRLMAKYPHLSYEQAQQHVVAAASNRTRQERPAAGK
jgi:hypothetical protein